MRRIPGRFPGDIAAERPRSYDFGAVATDKIPGCRTSMKPYPTKAHNTP